MNHGTDLCVKGQQSLPCGADRGGSVVGMLLGSE